MLVVQTVHFYWDRCPHVVRLLHLGIKLGRRGSPHCIFTDSRSYQKYSIAYDRKPWRKKGQVYQLEMTSLSVKGIQLQPDLSRAVSILSSTGTLTISSSTPVDDGVVGGEGETTYRALCERHLESRLLQEARGRWINRFHCVVKENHCDHAAAAHWDQGHIC